MTEGTRRWRGPTGKSWSGRRTFALMDIRMGAWTFAAVLSLFDKAGSDVVSWYFVYSSFQSRQEQSILFFVFSLLQSVPPDLNYLISHCIPTFVWIGLLVQLEKALVLGVTLIDKCLWHQKWRYIWQRYCDKPSCDQTTSFCGVLSKLKLVLYVSNISI